MQNQMNAAEQMGAELPLVGSATFFRLPQPGSRPNVFEGTELAMAMSFTPGLSYWYEINLYRKTDTGFAVAIRKFYVSEEFTDTVKSHCFETIDEAFNYIQNYDASEDLTVPGMEIEQGSPAEIASMALSLKAEVQTARAHYSGLVGELFAEMASGEVDLN
ncbi:MAG: hypothetical protein AAF871_03930 [Pseudomonadota bacterium]